MKIFNFLCAASLSLTLVLSGCKTDELPENPTNTTATAIDIIKNGANTQLTARALAITWDSLPYKLAEGNNFTIFLPTDAAINAFLAKSPNYSSISDVSPNVWKDLLYVGYIPDSLLYSPINSGAVGKDSLMTTTYTTAVYREVLKQASSSLSAGEIFVNVSATDVTVYDSKETGRVLDSAKVVSANLKGKNNVVVHLIDKVLVRNTDITPSSSTNLLAYFGYDSLLKAIDIAGSTIRDLYNNTSYDVTIFAPSNAAFRQYLSDNGVSSLSALNKDTLTNMLRYQIVPNQALTNATIATQNYATERAGGNISVVKSGNTITLNGNTTVIRNEISGYNLYIDLGFFVIVANTKIHAIDKVLLMR